MGLEAAIKELKLGWRGELIQPGDDGYDEARKVYNAMIDLSPDVRILPMSSPG